MRKYVRLFATISFGIGFFALLFISVIDKMMHIELIASSLIFLAALFQFLYDQVWNGWLKPAFIALTCAFVVVLMAAAYFSDRFETRELHLATGGYIATRYLGRDIVYISNGREWGESYLSEPGRSMSASLYPERYIAKKGKGAQALLEEYQQRCAPDTQYYTRGELTLYYTGGDKSNIQSRVHIVEKEGYEIVKVGANAAFARKNLFGKTRYFSIGGDYV